MKSFNFVGVPSKSRADQEVGCRIKIPMVRVKRCQHIDFSRGSLHLQTQLTRLGFIDFIKSVQKRMRFINLTRQTEIGANSYYLELDGHKLVVDAGLHPKEEGDAALPAYRLVPDGSLDTIIISHAHQDH